MNNEYKLVSYKNPKMRKLHYLIISCDSEPELGISESGNTPSEIIRNNKPFYLYGEHARGQYDELARLIQ